VGTGVGVGVGVGVGAVLRTPESRRLQPLASSLRALVRLPIHAADAGGFPEDSDMQHKIKDSNFLCRGQPLALPHIPEPTRGSPVSIARLAP